MEACIYEVKGREREQVIDIQCRGGCRKLERGKIAPRPFTVTTPALDSPGPGRPFSTGQE